MAVRVASKHFTHVHAWCRGSFKESFDEENMCCVPRSSSGPAYRMFLFKWRKLDAHKVLEVDMRILTGQRKALLDQADCFTGYKF